MYLMTNAKYRIVIFDKNQLFFYLFIIKKEKFNTSIINIMYQLLFYTQSVFDFFLHLKFNEVQLNS